MSLAAACAQSRQGVFKHCWLCARNAPYWLCMYLCCSSLRSVNKFKPFTSFLIPYPSHSIPSFPLHHSRRQGFFPKSSSLWTLVNAPSGMLLLKKIRGAMKRLLRTMSFLPNMKTMVVKRRKLRRIRIRTNPRGTSLLSSFTRML